MHLKTLSVKRRPFCPGGDELREASSSKLGVGESQSEGRREKGQQQMGLVPDDQTELGHVIKAQQ